MKRNLVISKWILLVIVASLLMPVYSCSEKRECLFNNRQSFNIEYVRKGIIKVSSKYTKDGYFFEKDGEYFASSDSILFLSTVRDTVIDLKSCGLNYKVIIKKEENGQFTTSSYLVRDTGCLYFLISYTYDSDYHISKIVKSEFVEYQ